MAGFIWVIRELSYDIIKWLGTAKHLDFGLLWKLTSNLIQYFKLEKETETSYYVLPTPAGVGVSGRVFEQLNTMS